MSRIPAERPEPSAADAAVARAAAFDDYLAGFAADSAVGASAATASGCRTPPPDDVSGLVDTMLLLRQAAAAGGAVPAFAPLAQPRSIGRHAILRRAGEGGFATVWEGFDTVLRRPVAVKVRRPELLLSESARRRFVREAEIAARLVHPHIVTIFEVGQDTGREFIAAEFCAGGSLAAWLEHHPGPLAPGTAARLVRALAGAVAHAHAAGVVHRDIKPANVLLGPAAAGSEPILPANHEDAGPAGGLTVKLSDFGLGKLHDEGDLADPLTQLTRTGTSIGTPAWMAPEQVDRSFGPVGPATDVHALGLLLHRLLTGRTARDAGTDAETYRQVLLDEPAPADQVVRGVPRDLAAVAAKCLAKQPRERYGSAADLTSDLDRWLSGRPTVARPLSPAARAARWVWRRPVVSGLAVAAVTASLLAAWVGAARLRDVAALATREQHLRRQQGAAELRRGYEALRAGNVAGALDRLEATRGIDPELARSLAGRWLVRRTHGERRILLAPDASQTVAADAPDRPPDLYAIALTADGTMAAVAGADGSVRLLRGLDGTPAITVVKAHDEVNEVGFSADGRRLVTAGQDGRLRWWDVTAAGLEPAGEASPGSGPLYATAFSPDGRSIAIGGEDRVLRLVDLAAGGRRRDLFRFGDLPGKSPEIESAIFIDSATLAASCGDLIVLVETATGRLVRELERPVKTNRNAVFGSLAASPDGRRLMACGTDATAHVWDLETGGLMLSLPSHPGWVQGCDFSSDGRQLATACRDGGVRVFDAASGRLVNRLLGHVGRVWSIAWEPTGTLLSTGADGTVRRWDPRIGFDAATLRAIDVPCQELMTMVVGPADPVTARERSSSTAVEGLVFATAFPGGMWQVDLDRSAARSMDVPAGGTPWLFDLDRSRGRLALSWRAARPVDVISTVPGGSAAQISLLGGSEPTDAIPCWTPAGELVIRSADGGLHWCPPDLGGSRRIGTIDGVVHLLAAAPAGQPRVAAIGDRALIHPLPRSPADRSDLGPPLVLPIAIETTAVAWSPDAAVVACGTRTGVVHLFAAATGSSLGSLAPHERMIEALAFSPEGRILFAADRDCVRLSEVTTLTTFDELRPGGRIRGLGLTADGKALVIAGSVLRPDGGDSSPLAVVEIVSP
jgi:WD40 repeat protein/tRNA A-37 threonylcarbamoyl transferase component Bud32